MDVLRTFVTGFELGSFASAAKRLGRSQSAVSTQLRKLEDQVGQPLVQRSGRNLTPTTAGETLLQYARRLLELNDEAVDCIRLADIEGWVRLGLPQDFAESWLPAALSRFSRVHPKVRIEVHVDRSVSLVEKVMRGELDVVLVWGDGGNVRNAKHVADLPMRWIARGDWPGTAHLGNEPLPFASFAPPCLFRSAAVESLDAAKLPWRLVFTSPSLSGLWAAAEGGLGITARTVVNMPKSLVALDPETSGLPPLPSVPIAIYHADTEPSPAVDRLTEIVLGSIQEEIGTTPTDIATLRLR